MPKRNVPMSASRSLKINLYKTCILSILFYASPIWSPSKTDLQKLESLNKRCIKWIAMTGDYNSTLVNLNIYPISYKLEKSDLLLFHRLFHGKYEYFRLRYPFRILFVVAELKLLHVCFAKSKIIEDEKFLF